MVEATELLGRIKNGGALPMITSCSPGWVNYAEYFYPEVLDNLSSCKSPHQMQGAIIKSYVAKEKGIDPKDLFTVSIMPCTAKNHEKDRAEKEVNGLRDIDRVLTTRVLARLIKRSGINFTKLPDEEYDQDIMGDYTGSGVIFGVTGGVMDAALRTANKVLSGKEREPIEFTEVRGLEGIKEGEIDLGAAKIKVAVASGMKNAKVLLDQITAGTSPYTFIEIMCYPGGCINGGGQPFFKPMLMPNEDDYI
jgi:NADP-reducing hydrogenase subunit HndD